MYSAIYKYTGLDISTGLMGNVCFEVIRLVLAIRFQILLA